MDVRIAVRFAGGGLKHPAAESPRVPEHVERSDHVPLRGLHRTASRVNRRGGAGEIVDRIVPTSPSSSAHGSDEPNPDLDSPNHGGGFVLPPCLRGSDGARIHRRSEKSPSDRNLLGGGRTRART